MLEGAKFITLYFIRHVGWWFSQKVIKIDRTFFSVCFITCDCCMLLLLHRRQSEQSGLRPDMSSLVCIKYFCSLFSWVSFWSLLSCNIFPGKRVIQGWICGGGAEASPQGFDPLPTQKVPLCTVLRYPFLTTDPKIFLRAPLAPKSTNFERGARAKKKRNFCLNALFWPVFLRYCLRPVFLGLW